MENIFISNKLKLKNQIGHIFHAFVHTMFIHLYEIGIPFTLANNDFVFCEILINNGDKWYK